MESWEINKISPPYSGSPICLISTTKGPNERHEVLSPINRNNTKYTNLIGYQQPWFRYLYLLNTIRNKSILIDFEEKQIRLHKIAQHKIETFFGVNGATYIFIRTSGYGYIPKDAVNLKELQEEP